MVRATRSAVLPMEQIAPLAGQIHRQEHRHPRGDHRRARRAWAASGCRSPRSTGARPLAASATTSAWSWRPRSCHGLRSAQAGLSSPAPRSSRGRCQRGHRGPETPPPPRDRHGRAHGRGRGHRARLRVGRREHLHGGDPQPGGGWLDQRGQDMVHLRSPRRLADAARSHRSGPSRGHRGLSVFVVPSREATRRASSSRRALATTDARPGSRPDASRAGRSTPSAIAACTPTRSRSRTGGCQTMQLVGGQRGPGSGLLSADAGIRERKASDRRAGDRRHAGGVRGRPLVLRKPQRVRPSDPRLSAHAEQSSAGWPP